MPDANSFEYWQAGEQPDEPQDGLASVGSFEYWQLGEQPPVYAGDEDTAAFVPLRGWGWGWSGA